MGEYLINNGDLSQFKKASIPYDEIIYDTAGVYTDGVGGVLYNITPITDSKLKGSFLANKGGKVYYVANEVPGNEFDREVGEWLYEEGNFKVLDYELPIGRYKAGEILEGYFLIEGVVTGEYELNASLNPNYDTSGDEISTVETFNIEAGEVKKVEFTYVTKEDSVLGFYGIHIYLKDLEDHLENWDYEYYVDNGVYLYSSDWHYYVESELYKGNHRDIGAGVISPDNTFFFEGVYGKEGYEDVEGNTGIGLVINKDAPTLDNITGMAGTRSVESYGTYEARIKVPEQPGLLNGFFMAGKNEQGNVYELDMEILFHEGKWQLWLTIHNESHKDYIYGEYLEDYDPNLEYSEEGEYYAEPGVVYQKKIDFDDLNIDPTAGYVNYRINYYPSFVSFEVNEVEVGKWDKDFAYHDLEVVVSTFWASWLQNEKYGDEWYEEMNVEWIRKAYLR